MIYDELSETINDLEFKKYIDFDKENQVFYHNFFFKKSAFVLKIALTPSLKFDDTYYSENLNDIKNENSLSLKYEKFKLTNYVYLMYFD